jgi:hypothetical protein
MNRIILITLTIFCSILLGQENKSPNSFQNFSYHFLSGINSTLNSSVGGDALIEVNASVYSNLSAKLSFGYFSSSKKEDYVVKTNSSGEIDSIKIFYATRYKVNKLVYDVFPLSVGLIYNFKMEDFGTFIFSDLSYNYLSTLVDKEGGISTGYSKFDDLPNDYKVKHIESFPNSSFSASIGFGVNYPIFNKVNIELRYFYKMDKKTVDTHHVLAGISF